MTSTLRPAASLLLLRDSPQGPQVLLTRRSAGMRSWAGIWVFPGGRAEDYDRDPANPAQDTPAAWCTAVRETFEETGVLIAAHGRSTATETAPGDTTQRAAQLAELRNVPSEEFFPRLAQQGFTLDPGSLLPWAHWIPPLEIAQRYDTRFFIAGLHSDDPLLPDGRETLEMSWRSPQQALAAARAGEIDCAPPTLFNLLELQQLGHDCVTVAQLLERARKREFITIFPRALMDQGERWVVYPWDPAYASLSPGGTLAYIPQRYYELPSRLKSVGSGAREMQR